MCEEVEVGEVVGRVERLDADALGRLPRRRGRAPAAASPRPGLSRRSGTCGEVGDRHRASPPGRGRRPSSTASASHAGGEVPVDARRRPRLAGEQHDARRPAARSAAAVVGGALGVERVGGAEHRDRRAGLARTRPRRRRRTRVGPASTALDPARLQQVAGEAGARGVGGERARAWPGTRVGRAPVAASTASDRSR